MPHPSMPDPDGSRSGPDATDGGRRGRSIRRWAGHPRAVAVAAGVGGLLVGAALTAVLLGGPGPHPATARMPTTVDDTSRSDALGQAPGAPTPDGASGPGQGGHPPCRRGRRRSETRESRKV
jgi:hypothetical protein